MVTKCSNKTENGDEKLFSKSMIFEKSNAVGSTRRKLLASKDTPKEKCAYRNGAHKLFTCHKFKEIAIGEHVALVRESKICFN